LVVNFLLLNIVFILECRPIKTTRTWIWHRRYAKYPFF